MSYDLALRLIEIGVAIAVFQRAFEHIVLGDRRAYTLEAGFALGVLAVPGFREGVLAVWIMGLWHLYRFRGPYNGGSDKMLLLAVSCLTLAHWVPGVGEMALAYLAIQLVLSYFVSGWVKLRNPDWRQGQALGEVFSMSAYPAAHSFRSLAARPGLMRIASIGVIAFELAFPLALLAQPLLYGALALATLFHFANACLFGLNRFVWAWVGAFPALLWFAPRIVPFLLRLAMAPSAD